MNAQIEKKTEILYFLQSTKERAARNLWQYEMRLGKPDSNWQLMYLNTEETTTCYEFIIKVEIFFQSN